MKDAELSPERAIRYVRDSFWAARTFTTLEECNRQALKWRDEVAHQRPWPDNRNRTVVEAFAEERPRLLELPLHEFNTERVVAVRAGKTIYARFDSNDYSIPPEAVGRELTLAASVTEVRILDRARELARHRRSYLHGLRRGLGSCFGIQAGAVAADDLRAGMGAQPLLCAFGAALGQQINYVAAFQIAENRAIAMPFAPRPIVDAHYARRSG